ncbi:hypothetical protein HGRIS_006564 [Hohenbuehelia grisea]|uniref:Protein kinase domain-containing protein n=1 Tax=Hohenbuehelia grisea TaxID=104357 RepID=A0ABR3J9D7_9AGAR
MDKDSDVHPPPGGNVTPSSGEPDPLSVYQELTIQDHTEGKIKFSETHLSLNHIVEALETLPPFVLRHIEDLDIQPNLSPDDRDLSMRLNKILIKSYGKEDFQPYFQTADEGAMNRAAGIPEVVHAMSLVTCPWENLWSDPKGPQVNESLMHAMYFYTFYLNCPGDRHFNAKMSNSPWPFRLLVQRASERVTYQPRSDFSVWTGDFPRLLVEVDSFTVASKWPQDCIRLALSGASVVRLANGFVEPFMEKKNFCLDTIFVRFDGVLTWYTMFQDGDDVRYHREIFSLDDSCDRLHILRRMYNLANDLKNEGIQRKVEYSNTIARLIEDINSHPMPSLHSGTSRKRPRSDGKGDQSDSPDGISRGSGSLSAELEHLGFVVEPQSIEFSPGHVFEPLEQLPAHVLLVLRPSHPAQRLIAKRIPNGSHEFRILQFLRRIEPQSENLISILHLYHAKTYSWAIFPKVARSLFGLCTATPRSCSGGMPQVCWGLIKGLAYLHKHRIAHRDISPSNLLVDQHFCLKIIDFDLAIQVLSDEEEVNDFCGTPGWMAPEVENASSAYSPIKADRWSCGRIILYVLDKFGLRDDILLPNARKLKSDTPALRPSLLQWPDWTGTDFCGEEPDKVGGMVEDGFR